MPMLPHYLVPHPAPCRLSLDFDLLPPTDDVRLAPRNGRMANVLYQHETQRYKRKFFIIFEIKASTFTCASPISMDHDWSFDILLDCVCCCATYVMWCVWCVCVCVCQPVPSTRVVYTTRVHMTSACHIHCQMKEKRQTEYRIYKPFVIFFVFFPPVRVHWSVALSFSFFLSFFFSFFLFRLVFLSPR